MMLHALINYAEDFATFNRNLCCLIVCACAFPPPLPIILVFRQDGFELSAAKSKGLILCSSMSKVEGEGDAEKDDDRSDRDAEGE